MSGPRRRTIDTVPAQLPFLVETAMPSRLHDRMPAAMSIDVRLADEGKRIRPLPRVPPTPRSAPPMPSHHRQLSATRPLPSLPESGSLAISVTPATPLPPPTPMAEASSAYLAPSSPRRGPPRSTSLTLNMKVSPDADVRQAFERTLPEPPTPRTAHRMRNSKLRRHLGESVQIVLDSPADGHFRHQLQPESDDSYSEESEEDVEDAFYMPSLPSQPTPPSPPSQKWVRERGKNRWTEANFAQILQDLRNL
ncbi:hypothetical protein MIND_00744300 [Mycena indigotica]|uniref:Uncharacterized protein n=1 Tax=Mycena indigotica TaxID=2126181 RepID=A0A8H6W3P9_9AGAR|nr:uncharacterized protein MIND_00744300 [Mycena indigotica]KAF7301786.1 hypothetical protein MIND_00744300 [Mycena indigotica]